MTHLRALHTHRKHSPRLQVPKANGLRSCMQVKHLGSADKLFWSCHTNVTCKCCLDYKGMAWGAYRLVHTWEDDRKERLSQATSSCPMICSCVWWFASAICIRTGELPSLHE